MPQSGDSRFAHWELLLGGAAVVLELFTALRYGLTLEYWWLAVVSALGTALLAMGADRSRYGEYALVLVGSMLIVAVVIGVPGLVDGAMRFVVGVWIGLALNRVAFGVLRPIPEYRRSKLADGETAS